jgi:two-component system phosphate regulon sensor histidine kinase PhoR
LKGRLRRHEATVRLRLYWRLGLAYVALLLAALVAAHFYAEYAMRGHFIQAGFEQLEAVARIALARPPHSEAAVEEWAAWAGRSGARVTVVAADGRVLADTDEDPAQMENHAHRPEIRQALASGEGRAVRYSTTVQRDLLYLALRRETPSGDPVVFRFAHPLAQIDQALAEDRRRLWLPSIVILLIAGGASLLVSRAFSRRVERLKQFSRRVADGDFRALPVEKEGDELAELARALNETAARLDETIRTLRDEQSRSAAILHSMVEGVAVIGADGRLTFCNEAFCRALGAKEANCEGRSVIEVLRQADLLSMVRKSQEGEETVAGEVEFGAPQVRSFSVTATPIPTEGGRRVVLVLHDISELRRLERVRRDFVANVSHELKTPLTAIQGFAETLLGGALEDAQNSRRFLQIIRDHATRLGRLTDDLLRLSQIEAGKLGLELSPVPLSGVIEPCLETTRLKAAAKNLTLTVECPPEIPRVLADARRLQEVLQNLLDNAVQYTPAGGSITVRAGVEGKRVRLSVTDTGIGIPSGEQARIFERFYRVDAARSRAVGGTGLGLSIAKHLVEAQGGRIEVESQVGRGSTFTIFLPAA